MHVALLTDADVFAGTERHILELAVALQQLPDAPAVSVVCPVPSPIADRAREAGIPIIEVPSSATGLLDAPSVRILRRLLKNGRVDILHAHNGRMALHAAIARVLARRGSVVTTQHFLTPSHASQSGVKGKVSKAAHRWVHSRVKYSIAISRAVETEMRHRGESDAAKIGTILNALPAPDESTLKPAADVRAELAVDAHTPLLVCAARLEHEKSIETLIDALALLRDEGVAAHCVVAGEGDEKAALQCRIDDSKLTDRVQLLGFRSDVLSLIRACEIFVLPSLAEPFGLVILEAMSLARPVIATNAGGPPEIVEDSMTGVLVPPADAPALAKAIGELIENPEKSQAMGQAGCARYEAVFRPQQMAESVLEVYRRVT